MIPWQPIETAPRDVEILALLPWGGTLEYDIVRWHSNVEAWYSYREQEELSVKDSPHYWMPLPPPPKEPDQSDPGTESTPPEPDPFLG